MPRSRLRGTPPFAWCPAPAPREYRRPHGRFGEVRHLWHTLPLDRFTGTCADPVDLLKETALKKDLHPNYVETQVTCTCGNTFTTRSTATSGSIHADVCSQCHPFFTGKQRLVDTAGRVERFRQKFAKQAS